MRWKIELDYKQLKGELASGGSTPDLGVSDSGGLIGLVDTTGASGTSITLSEADTGQSSVAGLGSLVFERWGQALVVRIEGCPLGVPGHELMSAYVEVALQVAGFRPDVGDLLPNADL